MTRRQSPGREPAIDPKLVSRHVRGRARGQKDERPFQVLDLCHAAERHAGAVLRLELIVLACEHAAGRQRVDAYPTACPVRREELAQIDDTSLRRAIGGRLEEGDVTSK